MDYRLAALTLETYFRDDEGQARPWLFPQLLRTVRRWRTECVTCKDSTFPQMLLLAEFAHAAADRIYRSIVATSASQAILKPILRPYDPIDSTRYVDFDTTREVWATAPNKCHVNYVPWPRRAALHNPGCAAQPRGSVPGDCESLPCPHTKRRRGAVGASGQPAAR